jgi:hypothetical protein
MRIVIGLPTVTVEEFEVDQRLKRAFEVLHDSVIRTRGGGRFADSPAAIILEREIDAPVALAALEKAGIQAAAM